MDKEQFEQKLALLDECQSACTRCGICSEACATFQLTGWEHESPRGRIRLAHDFLNGSIQPRSSALETFDRCLGCHSCEVSCPQAVPYSKMRQTVQELRTFLQTDLALFHPSWLKLVYRVGSAWWRSYGLWWLAYQHPIFKRSSGRFKKITQLKKNHSITLVISCLQDLFEHEIIEQAISFIQKLGYSVCLDRNQPCCGAFLEKLAQTGNVQANHLMQKRAKAFQAWLSEDCYFLARSCQCFTERQGGKTEKKDLYSWILEQCSRQNIKLVLSNPRAVYYQPYCGQAQKGVEDSIWQLLNQIEGLTLKKVPFPTACCGGFGGESFYKALDCKNSKWQAVPEKALIVMTSPECRHFCLMSHPDKNFDILHPIQLLCRTQAVSNGEKGECPGLVDAHKTN